MYCQKTGFPSIILLFIYYHDHVFKHMARMVIIIPWIHDVSWRLRIELFTWIDWSSQKFNIHELYNETYLAALLSRMPWNKLPQRVLVVTSEFRESVHFQYFQMSRTAPQTFYFVFPYLAVTANQIRVGSLVRVGIGNLCLSPSFTWSVLAKSMTCLKELTLNSIASWKHHSFTKW